MTTEPTAAKTAVLTRYNALRQKLGLEPLPTWTGTPEELLEAITKLQATVDKPAKGKAQGKAKKADKPAAPASDTFTVADLARDLDRDPKVVRAKLRGKDLPPFAGDRKWTWSNEHRDRVASLVKGTAPKMADEGEANF
jgi:hypothetical protein